MAIIECRGCGRKLRVPDEKAGKRARCPDCGAAFVVPHAAVPVQGPDSPQPTATESWYMRSPEGQQFGPIDKAELDRWVADGRVTADDQVLREGSDQWRRAGDVYPILDQAAGLASHAGKLDVATIAKKNPFAEINTDGGASRHPSAGPAGQGRQPQQPDIPGVLSVICGSSALMLDLLGCCCGVFVFAAGASAVAGLVLGFFGRDPYRIIGICLSAAALVMVVLYVLLIMLQIGAAVLPPQFQQPNF